MKEINTTREKFIKKVINSSCIQYGVNGYSSKIRISMYEYDFKDEYDFKSDCIYRLIRKMEVHLNKLMDDLNKIYGTYLTFPH